jgi:hypothetical protein
MTKYKYFKSKNYRSNVNLVTESDIVEVSDQTSEGGVPTLQEVTDEGAVTTNAIEVGTRIIVNDAGGDGDEAMRFNYNSEETTPTFVFENETGGAFFVYFIAPTTGVKTLIYSEESGVSAVSKTVNANFTAFNFASYTSIATLTITDPTPAEGQGYIVFVRNGTTTIGGVGYTSGNLIYRFYQGGAWSSTVFGVSAPISSATQTALDKTNRTYSFNLTPNTVIGTTAESILLSVLVTANTISTNAQILVDGFIEKNTNVLNTYRLYTNVTNDLSGSPQLIGTYIIPSGAARQTKFQRQGNLISGTFDWGFIVTTSSLTNVAQNSANGTTTTSFNPTADQYFILTTQNADTTVETIGKSLIISGYNL